jgi:hypothetical protein
MACGALAAALSKIEGLALRLALVFEFVRCASNSVEASNISAESMRAAVVLADWCTGETRRIYNLLSIGSGADSESTDLLGVFQRLGGEATAREIQHSTRRWRGRGEDLEETLQRMVGQGVLRRKGGAARGRGRPTIKYALVSGNENQDSSTSSDLCFRYRSDHQDIGDEGVELWSE